LNRHIPDIKTTCWMSSTSRRVKNSKNDERQLSPNHEFGTRLSTHFEVKKSCSVVAATANVIVQRLNDIVRHDLPLAATRSREANLIRDANLDTFAKEQSLVSSQYFVSQRFD